MLKDTHPEITVIITTYNEEEFIESSIIALQDQSINDFEIVIVDDGSDDSTVELIQRIDDPRINLIQKDHRGHYPALNTALRNSNGRFVAKVDPDDLPRKDRLEVQSDFLRNNPEIGVVGSAYKAIHQIRNEEYIRKYPTISSDIKKELTKYIAMPHSSMMFRKSALEDVGYYDDSLDYLGEVELLLRIGEQYELANIDSPLITRRIRQDSNFNQRYSDIGRATSLFLYNIRAVSIFNLPSWYYVYPVLSFMYKVLPKRAKVICRKYFSKLNEDY